MSVFLSKIRPFRLTALRKCNFSNKTHIHVSTKKTHYKKIVFGTIVSSLIAYDGLQNSFGYCKAVERFLRSSKITIKILADYAWNLKGLEEGMDEYDAMLKILNKRSAEHILEGCLQNGGLYVKLGQGVSAINHVLPIEFTETLKALQDKCLPRKPNEVRQIFLQDFGKLPEEVFAKFDYEPFAAASLAQVFRAETKSGDKVAVKVQYIDLQNRFRSDVGTILFLQNFVGFFFRNYKFGWIIEDLRENLLQELDFVHEGKNLEQCEKDLKNFDYVCVPKVHWDYTTTRILTAEYIDGIKISNVEELQKNNFDLSDVDNKLFTIFAEQIFNTGFVHADPHPGNVFVRKNKSNRTEIVLLDHGLYENLSFELRQNLCRFWKAIVLRDYKAMQKYSSEMNVDDYSKFAEILLQRPLEIKGSRFSTKLTNEEIEYMTKLAKKRFDLVMNTLKAMPRNLIFVVRNLNTVRAIAQDHGDPIDRPKVMARHALRCIDDNRRGLFGFIHWLTERITFEYRLWSSSTKYWLIMSYMKFLTKLGRAPDTSHLFKIDTTAAC